MSFNKGGPPFGGSNDVFGDLLNACSMPVGVAKPKVEPPKPAMSMSEALAFLQARPPPGVPPPPPDAGAPPPPHVPGGVPMGSTTAPPFPAGVPFGKMPNAPSVASLTQLLGRQVPGGAQPLQHEKAPEARPQSYTPLEGEQEVFAPAVTDVFAIEVRGGAAAAASSHQGVKMILTSRRLLWVNFATGKGTTVPLDKIKSQETGTDARQVLFLKMTLESGAIVTLRCEHRPENTLRLASFSQQCRELLLQAKASAGGVPVRAPVDASGDATALAFKNGKALADSRAAAVPKFTPDGKPIEKVLGFVPQEGEREIFVPKRDQKFEVEIRTKASGNSHVGVQLFLTTHRLIWVNSAAGGVTSVPLEKMKAQEMDSVIPDQPALTMTLVSGMTVSLGCRVNPDHIDRLNTQLLQARDSLAASEELGRAPGFGGKESDGQYWTSYLAKRKRDEAASAGKKRAADDGKVVDGEKGKTRWAGIAALVSAAPIGADEDRDRSRSPSARSASPQDVKDVEKPEAPVPKKKRRKVEKRKEKSPSQEERRSPSKERSASRAPQDTKDAEASVAPKPKEKRRKDDKKKERSPSRERRSPSKERSASRGRRRSPSKRRRSRSRRRSDSRRKRRSRSRDRRRSRSRRAR